MASSSPASLFRALRGLRGSAGVLAGLLIITAAALALRLPELDARPMHGDEAVHAAKLGTLWESGRYRYDPNEFHGPTLYYAALPVLRLAGVPDYFAANEAHYRLAPVLFGAGMVLLLWPLLSGLGRGAVLWAGALLAVSPALVFYSRYFIQETLLVCFTLGLLGCGWRYAVGRRLGWLLAAGACAGLMIATKETAVLTFFAAALALLVGRGGWPAARPGKTPAPAGRSPLPFSGARAAGAVAIALLVAGLFLSGFLSNPRRPGGLPAQLRPVAAARRRHRPAPAPLALLPQPAAGHPPRPRPGVE